MTPTPNSILGLGNWRNRWPVPYRFQPCHIFTSWCYSDWPVQGTGDWRYIQECPIICFRCKCSAAEILACTENSSPLRSAHMHIDLLIWILLCHFFAQTNRETAAILRQHSNKGTRRNKWAGITRSYVQEKNTMFWIDSDLEPAIRLVTYFFERSALNECDLSNEGFGIALKQLAW